MPTNVPLGNRALFGSVEDCTPLLKLADAVRGLLGVKLGHPPLVEKLTAAHGVAEVNLPVVAGVDIAEGRRSTTFSHDRVGLAEERLADDARVEALPGTLDGSAKTSTTGTDDDDVVLDGLHFRDVERH